MKIIKRIFVVVFGLLAAVLLFFFGSIGVDMLAGGSRLDALTNTRIAGQNGAPDVSAFVARPPGKVAIFRADHEIGAVTPFLEEGVAADSDAWIRGLGLAQ